MQRDEPSFSVIVPTHNRAHLIERALASIEAQTAPPLEVIVVDDGSRDNTQSVLAARGAGRLQVLRNDPARGVSASRNRGVSAAKGNFVVFLDDDDELRPNALAAIGQRLSQEPKLDFLWGARVIHEKDSAGREIGRRSDDWSRLPPRLSGTSFLPMVLAIATNSAFAIRRSVFTALGGFDETLKVSEDRDLFLALAERGHVGAAIDQAIIDIDEHFNGSLSRTVGLRQGPQIDLRVIDKHRQYLELPEHREFLREYLLTVFAGFLQTGQRGAALKIVRELARRGQLNAQIFRRYWRNSPELRALKSLIRYDAIRSIRYRMRSGGSDQPTAEERGLPRPGG